ncbi:MAG: PEP-CTERM sorting domain-containing protein [Acidobacteriota bacterium]|nr:PEP-CTERM sorting domain-containing protein [Acidobacteriota bacterium]
MCKKIYLLPLIAMVFLLQAPAVRADIVNGDFSEGGVNSDDLAGWIYETGDMDGNWSTPADIQVVYGETAVLDTETLDADNTVISLNQLFTIPALAQTLRFKVWFETIRVGTDDGGTPLDFLWVYYFDEEDPTFDRALLGFDALGQYLVDSQQMRTPTDYPMENGWLYFSAPISELAERSGTLYFDLANEDDGHSTIVKIDDVAIGTNPIPEPSTFLLLGSGLFGILAHTRKRYGSRK